MITHICVEGDELIGYDHHNERIVLDPELVEAVYYGHHIVRNYANGELTVVVEASVMYHPQFSSIKVSEVDRIAITEFLLNKEYLKGAA